MGENSSSSKGFGIMRNYAALVVPDAIKHKWPLQT